jgi:hypothetical protein
MSMVTMFFFSNYYVTNMKKITHEYSIKIDFFVFLNLCMKELVRKFMNVLS